MHIYMLNCVPFYSVLIIVWKSHSYSMNVSIRLRLDVFLFLSYGNSVICHFIFRTYAIIRTLNNKQHGSRKFF